MNCHSCTAKGQFATILCRIQKAERRGLPECLPNPMNVRVFGPPRRGGHILGVTRQFLVLANRNVRRIQEKNKVQVTQISYIFLRNTIRSEGRIKHVPLCDVQYAVIRQVAGSIFIPKRLLHFLHVCRKSFWPATDPPGATFESWSINETEECFFFQGDVGNLVHLIQTGWLGVVRNATYIAECHWYSLGSMTSSQCGWTQIICRSLQRILTVFT